MSLDSMILVVAYGLVVMDAPVKTIRLYRNKETEVSLSALTKAWSLHVFGLPLLTINALFFGKNGL